MRTHVRGAHGHEYAVVGFDQVDDEMGLEC